MPFISNFPGDCSRIGDFFHRFEEKAVDGVKAGFRRAFGKRPPDYHDGDDDSVMAHWALLMAGSAGWGNYRSVAGCAAFLMPVVWRSCC